MTAFEKRAPAWTYLFKIPYGHKFYAHRDGIRFSLADDSGAYPPSTDDGTLFLDFNRSLKVYITDNGHPCVWIPLVKEDNKFQGSTTTPISFLREVAQRWPKWGIDMSTEVLSMIESMKVVGLI